MDEIMEPADALRRAWEEDPRFAGIERRYEAEEVVRLRGSVTVEHSLARQGAERLWVGDQRKGCVRRMEAARIGHHSQIADRLG